MVGRSVGFFEGLIVGFFEGLVVGFFEGLVVGFFDGFSVGSLVGNAVILGLPLGCDDGRSEAVGIVDGFEEGMRDKEG